MLVVIAFKIRFSDCSHSPAGVFASSKPLETKPLSVSSLIRASGKDFHCQATGYWRQGVHPRCRVIPAMVQRVFLAIITQRDHKYATPPPWKQFYVFLATAPTGVLTAGTAWLLSKPNLWESCCTFMEKQRRCTIAGITVLYLIFSPS